MKSFAYKSTTLALIIFFQVFYFRSAVPFIEYEINKEYIAENLCENKDKPRMNCKGKCHLKKIINKAQKEEKKQKPAVTNENTLLFFLSVTEPGNSNLSRNNSDIIKYENLYSFLYITKLLKPPQYSFQNT